MKREKIYIEMPHVDDNTFYESSGDGLIEYFKSSRIPELLRQFLDSIRDYEMENGERICDDERGSEFFAKMFLEEDQVFNINKCPPPQKK